MVFQFPGPPASRRGRPLRPMGVVAAGVSAREEGGLEGG